MSAECIISHRPGKDNEALQMLMMAKKLCPLNNMQPCIGKKCVMYLDLTKLSATADTGIPEKKFSEFERLLQPPCALAVQGAASIIAILSSTQEASPPWRKG